MSILNIQEAKREGARLVIGVDALSGDGKTLSALLMAWGITGDSSKVGFLDTENRRGALYADKLVDNSGKIHRFKIANLDAPFTPERYAQAIKEFQDAGVEVLVIDSVTHEWEGSGGCTEIAELENSGQPRKFPAWNVAKSRHKKFMNTLLNSDMHIICCIRSREKMRIVDDPKKPGKTMYVSDGIQPLQEKNFCFELTVSFQLAANGTHRFIKKCPTELIPVFGEPGTWQEGYLTPRHGKALRDWVAGVDPSDANREKYRNRLRTESEKGSAAVQKIFDGFSDDIKLLFNNTIPNDILESAKAYDEMQQKQTNNIDEDLDG